MIAVLFFLYLKAVAYIILALIFFYTTLGVIHIIQEIGNKLLSLFR
jgi:hypothetical protein